MPFEDILGFKFKDSYEKSENNYGFGDDEQCRKKHCCDGALSHFKSRRFFSRSV